MQQFLHFLTKVFDLGLNLQGAEVRKLDLSRENRYFHREDRYDEIMEKCVALT